MEHMPAPLARRRLHGAAGADRAPVGRNEVDVHAEGLQQLRGDVALRLGDRLVLRHQARDRLAGISALGEQLPGPGDIALALEDIAALLGVERRARGEETRQRLPERLIVADQRAHVVFLVHRHQHGAARFDVVERRMQVVHPEHADVAERIGDVDADVAVLLQHRHEIGNRILPPVHLAVLQRGRCRSRIGDHNPLDAVDQHLLAAGEPGRLLLPRHIIGELLEHRLRAGHPFACGEFHRAGADILGDLLEGIDLGDALRHDEGARRIVLGQRQQHFRIRLLQRPSEGLVVDGDQFVLDCLDHQPHGIARRPARKARHHILAQHRLAIMKLEPGAKAKGPDQTVVRHLLGFDHLALRLQCGIDAVERVPHQCGRVANHILGPPDGIKIGEVGLGHETQGARGGALGQSRHRKAARRCQTARSGKSLQQSPAIHPALQVSSCESQVASLRLSVSGCQSQAILVPPVSWTDGSTPIR